MSPSAETHVPEHDRSCTTDTTALKSAITIQVHSLAQPRQDTLVLHPSFVTQDFDLLRFSAAAQNQLPCPDSQSTTPKSPSDSDFSSSDTSSSPSPAYSTHLISSPYNTPGHYLDLTPLSEPSRLFALALTALKPVRPDYATAPYSLSLNFSSVLSVLSTLCTTSNFAWPTTSFYLVTFHSQLKPAIDQDWLYKLDFESHREACESGGLLKYWFGKADLGEGGERRNLATCFWDSRESARKGGAGVWHAKARRAGRELYESIVFGTRRFTVLEGVRGWEIGEWVEEERR